MLIVTRKPGEAFRLNDDVRITVVRVSRDRVRIGIEAPQDTVITREPSLAEQANESRLRREKRLVG